MIDFKSVYKSEMNKISPQKDLLKRISVEAENYRNDKTKKTSFLYRHRTVFTAAATFVLILGIFSLGAIIVTNMNTYIYNNTLVDSDKNEEIGIGNPYLSDINDACDNIQAPGANGNTDGNMENTDDIDIDILITIADAAQNGTLKLKQLYSLEYEIESTKPYAIFYRFIKNGREYILTAAFEKNDPELHPQYIYICENTDEVTKGIDLSLNGNRLEDYFNGDFYEDIEG